MRLDIMQILQIKNLGRVVISEVRELLHSLEITGPLGTICYNSRT